MVRCGDLPRVVFDVVSPSELRAWRARNQRRRHFQDIEGVEEIVEIYQDEAAIHICIVERAAGNGPSTLWMGRMQF